MEILDFFSDLQKVAGVLNEQKYFAIFTHSYPDGDGIGSSVAFYKFLINIKKEACIFCNSEMPYQYEFLPYSDKILKDLKDIPFKNKYVAVFLDCADISRVKLDEEKIKESSEFIINIDHHLSNTNFGDINIVDSNKSATAEIIYQLLCNFFVDKIDNEIAEGLYTGILTDTGKFQYSNTTKNVHEIISKLLEYNINPSRIYSCIYECEPINRFKLLERVLRRIKLDANNNLIFSYILKNDFKKLNLPFSANDGIIEILRTAKNVKVAALFKEIDRKCFKVSLRASDENVNVANVANYFGGGGHKMAAAYTSYETLKKSIFNLIDALKNIL